MRHLFRSAQFVMQLKNLSGVCLQAILLTSLSSCSSTSLTDSWQAPTLHRDAMDNVLVVGMTANTTNRILFERGFVQALTDKGIQATASYDVIGDAMPTREKVTAYVSKSNTQFVIATRFGGTEVQKERVPESVRTYYTGPYYSSYAGYWGQYGDTVTMTRESYVDTKTTVVLTTSIFDAKSEELVWVGRSKTFEVGSIAFEANELAQQVINNIRK
jgi:hypothetical protein